MVKRSSNNKGVSLYIALMLTAVMLTIVFGLTAVLTTQIKTVRSIGYSVTAFYAAETGIEYALYNSDSCTSTCSVNGTLSLGGGDTASYSISGTSSGSGACPWGINYCIKSIGDYKNTKRAIQIQR